MTQALSYREAINLALSQEMERDPNVFVYGLDVSDHKRIYGTTKLLMNLKVSNINYAVLIKVIFTIFPMHNQRIDNRVYNFNKRRCKRG